MAPRRDLFLATIKNIFGLLFVGFLQSSCRLVAWNKTKNIKKWKINYLFYQCAYLPLAAIFVSTVRQLLVGWHVWGLWPQQSSNSNSNRDIYIAPPYTGRPRAHHRSGQFVSQCPYSSHSTAPAPTDTDSTPTRPTRLGYTSLRPIRTIFSRWSSRGSRCRCRRRGMRAYADRNKNVFGWCRNESVVHSSFMPVNRQPKLNSVKPR